MGLTWAGHEFLDSARDETSWNKATGQLQKVNGTFGVPLLLELLKVYAKQALGIH